MKFSIIIPAFNEGKNIAQAIKSAKTPNTEIIVVDAGSSDKTITIAKKLKAKIVKTKKKNRAHQQNLGAKHAKNDVLVFLHADGQLPKNWQKEITRKDLWGGFFIRFDNNDLFFRFVEFRSNWLRTTLTNTLFGDQAIFVQKELFKKIKGFLNIPIFEDILISKRLKQIAKPKIIKQPVITSSRRFLEHGKYKTYLAMFVAMLMYHLKFPLETIKKVYKKLQ